MRGLLLNKCWMLGVCTTLQLKEYLSDIDN